MVGGTTMQMVGLSDLDPELANIIRGFTTDLEDLKIE